MAGVNFLDRLVERESEEGIVGEEQVGRAGIADAIGMAFVDLTAHQKTSLILLTLGLGVIYFQSDLLSIFYFDSLLIEKNQINAELGTQVANLKNEVKGFGELRGQIEQFNKNMQDVRNKINEIESIKRAKRDFAIRLTDYVVAELPEGVWLEGISVDVKTSRKVELRGYSLDLTLIGNYIQRLEKGAFFPKWQLASTGNSVLPSDSSRETRSFAIDALISEAQ
jgi:Tfp pilus assembly protein PilN